MRYVLLVMLVTGSAALSGCFNDNDNNGSNSNPGDNSVAIDQANAELAVQRTSAVINASPDTSVGVNTAEPQDIDRIVLPEANLAEPVAVSGANASL